MSLASTSRTNIRYVVEQAFGVTPAAALGLPETLRVTGESLAYNIGKTASNEIRGDRQTLDLVATSASAVGGVNFELSYSEYDDLIEAALQGTWLGCNDVTGITCTITLSNTITASAGTPFANILVGTVVKFGGFATAANNRPFIVKTANSTVITVDGTPLTNEAGVSPISFTSYGRIGANATTFTTSIGTTMTANTGAPFANVVVGQWIKFSGMATGTNNVVAQVVTKTSSLVLVFGAATFAANEANPAAVISSSRLTDGTTLRSFSIEKEFADVAQFIIYPGMVASKMNLSFASGAMVTGSFEFLGKNSTRAGATQLVGTPNVSTAYDILNAVSGVGNILENGAALSNTYIKSATMALDNKARGQTAIGTLGNVGVGVGTLDMKGTIEVYLADGTLYDRFVANTASSLSFRVTDAAGNGYVFTFPKIKYADAKVNAGGRDQDAMISMPWEALMDTTTGHTVLVDRISA